MASITDRKAQAAIAPAAQKGRFAETAAAASKEILGNRIVIADKAPLDPWRTHG